ncbi:hypothetical protein ACBJ59_12335 [Nonomuraea sp. MTCD27]|uniref:hypothetical protein n=1 Tax=Nonomuraea sp. MTCD27 TaxID=1676747 RepID=UPI0035C1E9AA
MVSDLHIDILRQQVAHFEQVTAGWRYLLAHAEQVARAGTVMPDPMMPDGVRWPDPPANGWGAPEGTPLFDAVNGHAAGGQVPNGVQPYPAPNGAGVYDGTLPPEKENALGTLTSMHDAYAATPKAREEEQEWRQA